MEFGILGPLEVVDQGRVLALGGLRQRALLALLLIRANEVVSAERLAEELWDGGPPQSVANALHYHVSQLRKTLAPSDAIVTQEPGYVIRVGADELDLFRFERLVRDARQAEPDLAARLLRDALGLWRGPALADLANATFAQAEIRRLEELRLGALERRVEADLALGRHRELVAELEMLVQAHPLREGLRAALMRALYGSGRQADALETYRDTRRLLVDELGIEPSPALQELEQAILRHDPDLTSHDGVAAPLQRLIMVVASDPERLDALLAVAEPLARRTSRELILARLLRDDRELGDVNAALAEHRDALAERGVPARIAAFTTIEPGADAVRLAEEHDVDLIVSDAALGLIDGPFGQDLQLVLERAPCDVAVLVGSGEIAAGPIVTPFGGVQHDWPAIELAAWLAQSLGTTLRLLGTKADAVAGRRDASRLLARASLLVQQVVGTVTEPVLVAAGEEGVLEGTRDARLLVVGLSDRWRTEGVGPARLAVAAGSEAPTLFVRRGLQVERRRPGRDAHAFHVDAWVAAIGSALADSRTDRADLRDRRRPRREPRRREPGRARRTRACRRLAGRGRARGRGRPGREPARAPARRRSGAGEVWTGSHLDSVPNGGRFDGVLGVLAGLEAVERVGRRRVRSPSSRSATRSGASRAASRACARAAARASTSSCTSSRARCSPRGHSRSASSPASSGVARGELVLEGARRPRGHDAHGRPDDAS